MNLSKLRDKYLNVALDAVLHPASQFAVLAAREEKDAADMAPAGAEGERTAELTAQQWFERGFDAEDLSEKVRLYSQAIRLQPDYALALYNRGLARHDQGDLDGALRDYNEAIRLRPQALASHPRTTAEWNLRTETGEAGRRK